MDKKKFLVDILQRLENINEIRQIQDIQNEVEYFKNRIESEECRIAVVGEFSSGKSTFINAILGKDILKHALVETTAAVTRIINVSCSDNRANKGIVYFNNGQKVLLDNLDSIGEYTTTVSNGYAVVSEIEKVEIYVPFLANDNNLVFIDTPGLNGLAEGHREKTVEIIKQAHSCIYMLSRRGLSDSDIEFLKYLSNYQKNFIFIQNFIDDLKEYEGETVEEKVKEQENILKEKVFNEYEEIDFFICGVSAWLSLVSKDNNIKRLYAHSVSDITDEERKILAEKSNFNVFKDYMMTKYTSEYISTIQCRDAAIALHHYLKDLLEQLTKSVKQANDINQIIDGKDLNKTLEAIKQRTLENQNIHKNDIKEYITKEISKMMQDNTQDIADDLNMLNQKLIECIDEIADVKQLENYGNMLVQKVNQEIDFIFENRKDYSLTYIKFIMQHVLSKIETYVNVSIGDFDAEEIVINKSAFNKEDVDVNNGITETLNKEASAIKAQLNLMAQKNAELERDIRSEITKKQNIDANLSRKVSEKRSKLNALGVRPSYTLVTKTEIEYREREGFFGSIWGFFAGPKRVEVTKTVKDYTAQRKYDSEKEKIEQRYSLVINQLEKEKSSIESIISNYEIRKDDNNRRVVYLNSQLRNIEKNIVTAEQVKKDKIQYAMKEFLAIEKQKLKNTLYTYLLSDVDDSIKNNMEECLKKDVIRVREQIILDSINKYDLAVDKKMQMLESILAKGDNSNNKRLSTLNDAIAKIKILVNNLEANYELL